jgi:hypothetical protein
MEPGAGLARSLVLAGLPLRSICILVSMKSAYRSLLLLASLALAVSLHRASIAQTPQSATGQWTIQLGDRTLMVLSLSPSNGQSGPATGTLSRPTHLQTADAVSFSHVEGPTEDEPIVASAWKGDSLAITVQNPKDPGDKTEYHLTVKNETNAELRVEGSPLPTPLMLKRVTGTASVSDDWHSGETYSPDDDAPSNPEMKRIFEEDQRPRQAGPNIDWSTVSKADAARRAETMRLLNEGALHSGEDFNRAANIFQHGAGPDDFLFAHTLAIIAIRKGYSDATWIAAATLDRYLLSIKRRQIYGTQFRTPKGKAATQERYNRTLISDSLRRQLGVPDLAAQQVQRQQYDSKQPLDSKNGKP